MLKAVQLIEKFKVLLVKSRKRRRFIMHKKDIIIYLTASSHACLVQDPLAMIVAVEDSGVVQTRNKKLETIAGIYGSAL